MSKSTMDLRSIASAGGSIKISSTKSTMDLRSIASALNNDAKLTIKDAGSKSTMDLRSIASAKPGQVIFEFD